MVAETRMDIECSWKDPDGILPYTLRPMPGTALVKILPEMEAQVGGIWIPETSFKRDLPGAVGIVLAEAAIVGPTWRKTIRGTVGRTCLFPKWAGQRFKIGDHQITKYNLTVEHFVAVYFDGEWVPLDSQGADCETLPGESGIARCPYCRTSGHGNMLLDGDGVCPTCGRYATGRPARISTHTLADGTEVKTRNPVKITDEDREVFA